MSQYRDHRDAARHRVEALESTLAERDAEIAEQGAALEERDAEIVRLRRELVRVGTTLAPGRGRPVSDAWMGRVVGVAVGLSMLTAVLGAVVMRKAPARVLVNAPTLADPGVAAPAPAPPPALAQEESLDAPRYDRGPSDGLLDEERIRRQLEPKVLRGSATVDEIKMLKAICSHLGDRACRARASAELARRAAHGDPLDL